MAASLVIQHLPRFIASSLTRIPQPLGRPFVTHRNTVDGFTAYRRATLMSGTTSPLAISAARFISLVMRETPRPVFREFTLRARELGKPSRTRHWDSGPAFRFGLLS